MAVDNRHHKDPLNSFHVEKLRRAVSIVLIDGRRLDGDVFLFDRTRVGSAPEEPLDLLNDNDPFFPFSNGGGQLILIAKDQVSRVETEIHDDSSNGELADGLMGVDISLHDGTAISGFVPLERRGEQTRLLDYLNSYTKRFIPVFWGEQVCLVNRGQIACVSQLT